MRKLKDKNDEGNYRNKYTEKKSKEFGLTIRETVNKIARDYHRKVVKEIKELKDNKPAVYKYLLDNAWEELMNKYLVEEEKK